MLRIFLLVSLLGALPAAAHDIPDDVRVRMFVKPEGQTLVLVARVPLSAMREVDVPRRPGGYLDFSRVDSALREAVSLWLTDEMELYENGTRIGRPKLRDARIALESDKSFTSYENALAGFSAPRLRNDTQIFWNQGLLDVVLDYPISSADSDFSIRPHLERLGIRVNTVIRFKEQAFSLHGDPGLVHLDPRWHQAALRFVQAGIEHILSGLDHLLFLALLVVPFRRFVPLLAIVTAFTVAHSITLITAALGHGPDALWFPPLVEVLIAASILYMALENVVGSSLRRRWALTLAFGLVHGFGFAYGLREQLQFAGSHLVTSLLAFNVGIEIGQIAALLVFVPVLNLAMRANEKLVTILISLLVGHTAWHWLLERGEKLAQFPLPSLDAASLASLIRWLMGLIVVGIVAWYGSGAIQRLIKEK